MLLLWLGGSVVQELESNAMSTQVVVEVDVELGSRCTLAGGGWGSVKSKNMAQLSFQLRCS